MRGKLYGMRWGIAALAVFVVFASGGKPAAAQSAARSRWQVQSVEGDYVAKNFKFRDGETLSELKLHYTTLGKPQKDAGGRVTNAVLILHGTGGTGHQFFCAVLRRRTLRAGAAAGH